MSVMAPVEIVQKGEPYTPESVMFLCLQCPLPDCDNTKPLCLVRMARRRDKRLHDLMYYGEWLAGLDEERLKLRQQNKLQAAKKYQSKKREANETKT